MMFCCGSWQFMMFHDSLRCFMMIGDDLWWFVMFHGGSKWFMMFPGSFRCFVIFCGGSWWFVIVRDVLWWFMMIRDVSWWFVMVRGGSWWFVVVFLQKSQEKSHVTLYLTNQRTKFTMKSHFWWDFLFAPLHWKSIPLKSSAKKVTIRSRQCRS